MFTIKAFIVSGFITLLSVLFINVATPFYPVVFILSMIYCTLDEIRMYWEAKETRDIAIAKRQKSN